MKSFEQKTLNSFFWNVFEVVSTKGIAFIVGIIIARILLPEDFGVIAIANVFISFGQVILVSGFISALVQHKEVSDAAYSSVFYFNILFGIILYILFFFLATVISDFYDQEELTIIIRILSLNILTNSLFIVQFAIAMKQMKFKRLAIINITTGTIAGTGGIIAAYMGLGLWAIVIQSFLNSIIALILFWVFSNWRPLWIFSKKEFLNLYSYAYKLFLNVVMKNVVENIYNLVIGRYYSITELGYYSKANDLQRLPVNTIYQMVSKVSFSYFSKIQDEKEKYTKGFILIHNSLGFIIIFVMGFLILNASEIISLLLTDKWLPSTNFFRLLCICGIIIPLSMMISNTLEAKGLASVTLKITFFEKFLMIIALIATINYGIALIILGMFTSLLISYVIKIVIIKNYLNLTVLKILNKVFINLIIAIGIGICVYYVTEKYIYSSNLIRLITKSSVFTIAFLTLTYLVKTWPLSIPDFKVVLNQYRNNK